MKIKSRVDQDQEDPFVAAIRGELQEALDKIEVLCQDDDVTRHCHGLLTQAFWVAGYSLLAIHQEAK